MNRWLRKLHQAWLSWDLMLRKMSRWMDDQNSFFEVLETSLRHLKIWPFLRLLKNRYNVNINQFSIFRARLEKVVSFRSIMWLDGVGDFNEDRVYKTSEMSKFLFVLPLDQDYVTLGPNFDASIRTCVIDLLLGEHYNVNISDLSERVVNVNHRERRQNRVLFHCGRDYCAISNKHGQMLRFSKNPAQAMHLPDAFVTFTFSTRFHPAYMFFPLKLRRIYSFPFSMYSLSRYSFGADRFYSISCSLLQNLFQSNRSVETTVCCQLGSEMGCRAKARNPAFGFKLDFFPSKNYGRGLHNPNRLWKITVLHESSTALRTMLFASRLISVLTFYGVCIRAIFEPRSIFSLAFYCRLVVFYALSSVRNEFHNSIRKLFPSSTVFYGLLDTNEWRWIGTSYIPGLFNGISEASLEAVYYNCASMPIERFPNVELKKAAQEIIRHYNEL
uniref:Uncharacterized protein n=1 Tax=Ditylenchus dipsaci TaxID=166011 RepID=A0A915DBD8_9BILA